MTKSISMPSHMVTSLPDPFPELSRHKMRLYHFHNADRTRDQAAPVPEAERRSPNSVPNSNSVNADDTSSTANHLTEVDTHTRLTALFFKTTWVSRYQKGRTSLDFTEETVSGSGIGWAVCKSAPRSGQITMPATHHSVFYRPDALPAAQRTASKH